MHRTLSVLAANFVATGCWAQDAHEGAALYLDYCATCHGIDLDGQGPMAGAMVIKPASPCGFESQQRG